MSHDFHSKANIVKRIHPPAVPCLAYAFLARPELILVSGVAYRIVRGKLSRGVISGAAPPPPTGPLFGWKQAEQRWARQI